MTTRVARNAPLDAVRGIAAVGVFVFHTSNRVGETYGEPYQYLGHLDVGVRVFFILSGYFIYKPFVRAHLRDGRGVAIGEYVWKRFWRIYPAYWLALAFAVAVDYATIEGLDGLFKHGLLVQNFFDDEGGTGLRESWTLVVEITLYVLVPVFAVAVRLLGRLIGRVRAEVVASVGLLLIAVACLPAYVDGRGVFAGAGLGRVLEPALPAAAAGMLLAVLDTVELSAPMRARLERVAAPAAIWWGAAGAVYLLLVGWLADDFTSPQVHNSSAPGWIHYQWGHALIATLLVAPLVLAPGAGGRLRAFLSQRWVVFLGVVSFSFYLWHIRVLTFVLRRGGFDHGLGWAALAASGAFAVALLFGWLGQRYIEQPCARVAARWPLVATAPKSTRQSPTTRGAAPGR